MGTKGSFFTFSHIFSSTVSTLLIGGGLLLAAFAGAPSSQRDTTDAFADALNEPPIIVPT
eukprot:CAMPEP_0201229094 /NCGR_PEP_ID=MMETSP0852-20130820/685_1 /ASSEMBLY_ACC=CAM_ASM_000632 /TAXON_ID=183588 /ORGANISM="Pseudo-nitzschia fraudulenta, Strain WWA7" /LENGTH=59 /DNA_ID=CAMNT_0047519281 /DNA_START=639 /DNA_END=818 /DNA_ORIENTATION=-